MHEGIWVFLTTLERIRLLHTTPTATATMMSESERQLVWDYCAQVYGETEISNLMAQSICTKITNLTYTFHEFAYSSLNRRDLETDLRNRLRNALMKMPDGQVEIRRPMLDKTFKPEP